MSEIRRDEIVYEEGWRDHITPPPAEETPPSGEDQKPSDTAEKSDASRPLLTIIQLILCMLAALILFLLKAMDSGAYHEFMNAYDEEMQKPVISQKVFDAVDWNALFRTDSITVKATPDELPPR